MSLHLLDKLVSTLEHKTVILEIALLPKKVWKNPIFCYLTYECHCFTVTNFPYPPSHRLDGTFSNQVGTSLWYLLGVIPGGAPPDFGRSVKPISTKGGRLCPQNNTGIPGFSDLSTVLNRVMYLPLSAQRKWEQSSTVHIFSVGPDLLWLLRSIVWPQMLTLKELQWLVVIWCR